MSESFTDYLHEADEVVSSFDVLNLSEVAVEPRQYFAMTSFERDLTRRLRDVPEIEPERRAECLKEIAGYGRDERILYEDRPPHTDAELELFTGSLKLATYFTQVSMGQTPGGARYGRPVTLFGGVRVDSLAGLPFGYSDRLAMSLEGLDKAIFSLSKGSGQNSAWSQVAFAGMYNAISRSRKEVILCLPAPHNKIEGYGRLTRVHKELEELGYTDPTQTELVNYMANEYGVELSQEDVDEFRHWRHFPLDALDQDDGADGDLMAELDPEAIGQGVLGVNFVDLDDGDGDVAWHETLPDPSFDDQVYPSLRGVDSIYDLLTVMPAFYHALRTIPSGEPPSTRRLRRLKTDAAVMWLKYSRPYSVPYSDGVVGVMVGVNRSRVSQRTVRMGGLMESLIADNTDDELDQLLYGADTVHNGEPVLRLSDRELLLADPTYTQRFPTGQHPSYDAPRIAREYELVEDDPTPSLDDAELELSA